MNDRIKVTMKDLLDKNQKQVERIIDISCFSIPDYNAPSGWESNIIAPIEKQAELLKRWISDFANEQHNTLLELVSFEII